MNGRIFRLDIPAHQTVQELLPWYATAQLSEEDMAKVEAHLHGCVQCQQDLQWERGMRASANAVTGADSAQPEGLDADRAFARLLPQLGEQEPAGVLAAAAASADKPLPWWRAAAANQPSWLRWAALAQCVIIAGLLILLGRPDAPVEYRAMGAADANVNASSANLVVIFQPDATEHALRAALQAQGARIVDGPTVTDAYLLAVPPAERSRILQALRADPAVKLAESIDSGGAQ
ncbi:MAG: zf-HC2 domain-containing protein [Paucibacter sp.]|nr:zf-HC2 domain-containing protein [Roseateles sp.]